MTEAQVSIIFSFVQQEGDLANLASLANGYLAGIKNTELLLDINKNPRSISGHKHHCSNALVDLIRNDLVIVYSKNILESLESNTGRGIWTGEYLYNTLNTKKVIYHIETTRFGKAICRILNNTAENELEIQPQIHWGQHIGIPTIRESYGRGLRTKVSPDRIVASDIINPNLRCSKCKHFQQLPNFDKCNYPSTPGYTWGKNHYGCVSGESIYPSGEELTNSK